MTLLDPWRISGGTPRSSGVNVAMTANVLSAFRFRISRHNGRVLTTVRILVCLLVVLAGCTTAPRD
ncbi:MAG TPA: hypothetical protein VI136_00560, partial [Verrucomicrobiae bacterium]